ncbi:MAG: recombinase family protein [Acidobacteriota bacterium]|nr:recombinase family protein [Acidobacteriota bacterium]
MTKPILVAIYARVSTNEQNPEAQLFALREYASRRGFSVYKEYVDRVSGNLELRRSKRQTDSAYRSLMDDAGRRSFDCVLVWKYDRFARSLNILVAALQQFSTLGIDFISYTQNIDTTTAMGRLFYHVIGSFAEFEREVIVERVRAGLANARAKGQALGRPKDHSAELRIIDLRKQGLSLREIADREERSASGVLQILRRAAPSGGPE